MDDTEFRLYYGAAWLNLIATLTGRRSGPVIERLDSPHRLADWFVAIGLPPRKRPGVADLAPAIELREALYELARAAVDGRRPGSGAVRTVDRVLSHDAPPRLRLSADNLAASAPPDAQAALARIARQATEHLTGTDPVRLRACADPTCAGIYLDESGRRRWCADKSCGVRSRVRAHRARVNP